LIARHIGHNKMPFNNCKSKNTPNYQLIIKISLRWVFMPHTQSGLYPQKTL